jgi:predicted peroxiredoxin
MKKEGLISWLIIVSFVSLAPLMSTAGDKGTFLVHLKTSLKKDDAQICVAYNMMWAALEEGYDVKVLVDADAINTFKVGWRGKDDIEGYKIPENLRAALAKQFSVSLKSVPKTYGDFLQMLKDRGVEFYINTGFLIVSKIGTREKPLKKVSNRFFKPVTLKEMVRLRTSAAYYMAY